MASQQSNKISSTVRRDGSFASFASFTSSMSKPILSRSISTPNLSLSQDQFKNRLEKEIFENTLKKGFDNIADNMVCGKSFSISNFRNPSTFFKVMVASSVFAKKVKESM